ncbi:MAG: T9SS type A sorting domain-containing protein [bacterium]|nr:T9SS type A sorting domain-containing protein [bacterium]
MKKSLLILFALIQISVYAQLEYTFVKSTGTYAELVNPTVLPDAWTQTFKTKLPFSFTFFSKAFDSLKVIPNTISFTAAKDDVISMGQEYYYDTLDNKPAASEISYAIIGTTPNRIVKVQFKNLEVVPYDTAEQYIVNGQIWLYETTNNFEFHFGPSTITDINFTEYYFGFRDSDGSPYLAISGTAASPTLVKVANAGTFMGISSQPANGTVYTFAPYVPSSGVLGIDKPYQFANTEEGFKIISSNKVTFEITNVLGQNITSQNVDGNNTFIFNTNQLSKGMYLVSIVSNNQIFFEKIIVQ